MKGGRVRVRVRIRVRIRVRVRVGVVVALTVVDGSQMASPSSTHAQKNICAHKTAHAVCKTVIVWMAFLFLFFCV